MEAAYYDNIIEQQRIEPEFFRMGFYGRKFPFFLRVRLTKSSLIKPGCQVDIDNETRSANNSPLSQRVKLNPFLLQFLNVKSFCCSQVYNSYILNHIKPLPLMASFFGHSRQLKQKTSKMALCATYPAPNSRKTKLATSWKT